MDREELKQYIGITGHSLGQVEKDYLQHIILGAISRNIGGEMTFKGGTALQKMGILRRFSEDLDFTEKKPQRMSRLETTVRSALEAYNYPSEIGQHMDDERTIGFRLLIQGPLYRGKDSLSSIRIEISKRETILRSPEQKEITPPYKDILSYTLEIMSLEEIASEKVRAILTRNKARDLYDLQALIRKGAKPDIELINEKLQYYNTEYAQALFEEKCEQLGKRWDNEMTQLLGRTPDHREAYELVTRTLGQIY